MGRSYLFWDVISTAVATATVCGVQPATTPAPAGPRPAGRGALLTLAGAALWGTTGTSQALLPGAHSPIAVGGLRTLIACCTMVIVSLLLSLRRPVSTARAPLGWLLFAGVGVAGYQLTFFGAVARTGVGVGTLVMLATAPLFAGLLGWLVDGLRPTRSWLLATTVALVGASLLVLGSAGPTRLDALGITLGVAAGICFGSYTFAGRHLAASAADGTRVMALVFLIALAVLALPLARSDLRFVAEPRALALLAWLGVVATALAYLLFQTGLRQVEASTAATLSLAEPMVANLLAVVVLREHFTATMGVGVVVILLGLALLGRPATGPLRATR